MQCRNVRGADRALVDVQHRSFGVGCVDASRLLMPSRAPLTCDRRQETPEGSLLPYSAAMPVIPSEVGRVRISQ